jgi:hypothetical protein
VSSPEAIGARKAKNGFYYIPDPDRPGKFMIVLPKKGAARERHLADTTTPPFLNWIAATDIHQLDPPVRLTRQKSRWSSVTATPMSSAIVRGGFASLTR